MCDFDKVVSCALIPYTFVGKCEADSTLAKAIQATSPSFGYPSKVYLYMTESNVKTCTSL